MALDTIGLPNMKITAEYRFGRAGAHGRESFPSARAYLSWRRLAGPVFGHLAVWQDGRLRRVYRNRGLVWATSGGYKGPKITRRYVNGCRYRYRDGQTSMVYDEPIECPDGEPHQWHESGSGCYIFRYCTRCGLKSDLDGS